MLHPSSPVDPRSAGLARVRRRRPGRLAVAVLLGLVLAACSGDPAPVVQPRETVRDGGTLRLAVPALPGSFNPYRAEPFSAVGDLLGPATGSAVQVQPDGSWEVDPLYAESVEIVGDAPLSVAVRLNPDGVWSDGSPIDAADMQAFVAAQQGAAGQQTTVDGWGVVTEVQAGEDPWSYTVVFAETTADWPAFVYPGLPAEATAPDVYNGFVDAAPPGNGPFVVDTIDRESGTVELVRNPQWWGPEPRLDAVTFTAASSTDRAEAFEAGDLDAVTVDEGTVRAVAEGDDARLLQAPSTDWSQLTLNAARGPLSVPEVRRAVALAVDRDGIVADTGAALDTEAEAVGSVLLLPGQRGYRDTAEAALPHDPAEARRLLEAAGYTRDAAGLAVGGDGVPLTLTMPVPAGTDPNLRRTRRIADDLADVGITVDVVEVPAEEFFATVVVPLAFDLVTFLWDGEAFGLTSATARYAPVDAKENFTGQADPTVADLGARLRLTLDPAARDDLVAQFDAAVFAAGATVPLAVEPQVLAVAEDVVNLEPRQFGGADWTSVGFRG
ncbi:ABC transporter family substrate-binding protein [Aeromicrobium marinum]|uniref:ABC transporter family substrate-binding protein n=1 Tax=Aeromicrobium marinum TaxID=219314 RepID=UPI00058CAF74|nr:ABC transporter family substrate-binding protein [Aeromicrobium marinum]